MLEHVLKNKREKSVPPFALKAHIVAGTYRALLSPLTHIDAPSLGSPRPHLHQDWARPRPHLYTGTGLTPAHICTGTGRSGLTPPTSALARGSPPPTLAPGRGAHPCRICTALAHSGLIPGPCSSRSPPPRGSHPVAFRARSRRSTLLSVPCHAARRSALPPHLCRDWAHPRPHLRRDSRTSAPGATCRLHASRDAQHAPRALNCRYVYLGLDPDIVGGGNAGPKAQASPGADVAGVRQRVAAQACTSSRGAIAV